MNPETCTYTMEYRKTGADPITRDDIPYADMVEMLTSAVALAGVNFGGSLAFVSGITDRYTVKYRRGGPADIFGETPQVRLTVSRNLPAADPDPEPTPAGMPVMVITADGVTGGTLNPDDTITPDPSCETSGFDCDACPHDCPPDPDGDRVCVANCDRCDTDTAAVCESFGDHREVVGMTTDEMRERYTVIGFMAPFVVVDRKADGVRGSLEFTHMPRRYFGWTADR